MAKAIVTTTINVPYLLEGYARNVQEYGHDDVLFVVAGDKKTPPEAQSFCRRLGADSRNHVVYLTVEDQEEYLGRYPELRAHLPFNCIQRRNVGILLAYEEGADVIITIDDDNYISDGDFVGCHSIVGTTKNIETYRSSNGWFNVCDYLIEESGYPFYHRGFPIMARWPEREEFTSCFQQVKIAVNAGLWLEEPDIDAITRLTLPIKTTGYRRDDNFALAPGTWSPFNSQNTAIAREVIPAYFLCPNIGRYDDIWASYVVKAIADHLNQVVTFGYPLVKQTRNPHNNLSDLEQELEGMSLTDAFCDRLRGIKLSGNSYRKCYEEIYQNLCAWVNDAGQMAKPATGFIERYLSGMKVWMQTMQRVHAA